MRSLDDAIEWVYGLHVGGTGTGTARQKKLHKPVLLLAALDLLADGQATPERILQSQALRVDLRMDKHLPREDFLRALVS